MKAIESVGEINTVQLLLGWKTGEKRHVRERVGKGTFKLSTKRGSILVRINLSHTSPDSLDFIFISTSKSIQALISKMVSSLVYCMGMKLTDCRQIFPIYAVCSSRPGQRPKRTSTRERLYVQGHGNIREWENANRTVLQSCPLHLVGSRLQPDCPANERSQIRQITTSTQYGMATEWQQNGIIGILHGISGYGITAAPGRQIEW